MARTSLVLACVVLASLCSVVFAQQPVVQANLQQFDQNGGVLTVYGSGFIQRNLNQFIFRLVTPAGCVAPGCRFYCHWRTMIVNPAGTIAQCEVPYIPDGTLGLLGQNYITLQIVNANGASGPAVTVATVRPVASIITASTSNAIPVRTTGITVMGTGFPSENSIFNQGSTGPAAAAYTLLLTDNTITTTIDLLAARSDPANSLTANPMDYWDVTTVPLQPQPKAGGQAATGGQRKLCRFSKVQVDCWYLSQTADWVSNNNQNGLFASLIITQAFGGLTALTGIPNIRDTIGPVQIGVITANNAPVITPVTIANPDAFIGPNDPNVYITATNILGFPAHLSNIFVPQLNAGGNRDLRCDTIAVTATQVQCQLTARGNQYRNDVKVAAGLLGANPIAGILFAGFKFTAGPVSVAFVNSAGTTALKYPLNTATRLPDTTQAAIPNAVLLNDAPIQQDQRVLVIKSPNGAFYPPDIVYLFQYALSTPAALKTAAATGALAPEWIDPVITLTGLYQTAGVDQPVQCRARAPDQVEPNTTPLVAVSANGGTPNDPLAVHPSPQSDPANDQCIILSMSSTEARLLMPGAISQPVGSIVSATVEPATPVGRLVTLPTFGPTAVGIVAPGAGVGGDPHFFGFLGEKYEFAGEAGRIYNLLSDEGVQLNAEIGYWHWNRGKETIIRKLALKTDDHRVLIDAGGNHLGTEGFSISVDGSSIAPSRTRKTYLGSDGWVRWHPLAADDKFRLPLWERHQGVALVEIFLNDYKFEVLAVEEGKDAEGVWHKQPSRFLDFMAAMINERRPHGLFGQSAHLRANQRSTADFTIEGTDNDYEVTGLFGDDFSFNKFSAKK